MIEIVHHPKWGLVDYTVVKWNRPINADEAESLAAMVEDAETESDRLTEAEEKIADLENELADEKARWRARVKRIVRGLREKAGAEPRYCGICSLGHKNPRTGLCKRHGLPIKPSDPLADLFSW